MKWVLMFGILGAHTVPPATHFATQDDCLLAAQVFVLEKRPGEERNARCIELGVPQKKFNIWTWPW